METIVHWSAIRKQGMRRHKRHGRLLIDKPNLEVQKKPLVFAQREIMSMNTIERELMKKYTGNGGGSFGRQNINTDTKPDHSRIMIKEAEKETREQSDRLIRELMERL
jgi:hypothetical protein